MTETILFWSTVAAYAASAALFFVWVAFGRPRVRAWALAVAAAGLAPHAAGIALRWAAVGHGPYQTRYEVLSADAFLLVGVYLAAALLARGLRGLGAFVLPVAFLLLGASLGTFETRAEVPIIFKSGWLAFHVGFAKLFAATSLLAAASAGGYLVKRRAPARLPWLPSAERLELQAHQFLLVSFLFLGVMIVAGALWAHQSWGRYWGWDPMETSSLVTWIVFAIVLHFRVLHGWSGARMAALTFVALAFALATVFVVALAVPTIHDSYLVGG